MLKSIEPIAEVDPQEKSDQDAVMRHAFGGLPIEPETLRRVQERARRVTEEIRRSTAEIDIEKLLHDSRNEP